MTRSIRYFNSLVVLAGVFFIFYSVIFPRIGRENVKLYLVDQTPRPTAVVSINWRNLTSSQINGLSTLGKWLLEPRWADVSEALDYPAGGYLILIWKYGSLLERRHLKRFGSKAYSPWDNCSVKNCRLSYDSMDAERADAILFHLHQTQSVEELPRYLSSEIRMRQRWIFMTDESPLHTFLHGHQHLSDYNGLFNWSMTYRMDSDIPVPYGRTLAASSVENFDENFIKSKTKLVAIMGSNCGRNNGRWEYVKNLRKALEGKLDIYGVCLHGDTELCPRHYAKDCQVLKQYKCYLAFENSNCKEYLTEKPFWHGYQKYSVPIIMGPSRYDCNQLLPPKSFIHVDDFANPNTLADYLLYLDENHAEYMKFHNWRKNFTVLNEHGYFRSASRHYCRLCEALNYNDPSRKVYDNIEEFWSANKDCKIPRF